MPHIVAVDDEADVLASIGRSIGRDGIEMTLVRISTEAEAKIAEVKPDMVILDVSMPGMDGITLCRRLRATPDFVDLPILFLTAKTHTDEIVAGLDAGADDYVVKPFHLNELRARVDALLRRGVQGAKNETVVTVGGLALDSKTHQVTVEHETVQLTNTEHLLMRYLMENAGKPQSPAHLLESVWEYPPDAGDPDLVRAHIRNLRAKLKKATGNRYIETVHSVGYVIE